MESIEVPLVLAQFIYLCGYGCIPKRFFKTSGMNLLLGPLWDLISCHLNTSFYHYLFFMYAWTLIAPLIQVMNNIVISPDSFCWIFYNCHCRKLQGHLSLLCLTHTKSTVITHTSTNKHTSTFPHFSNVSTCTHTHSSKPTFRLFFV